MKKLVWLLALAQTLLAIRVFGRMARTANGERIQPVPQLPRSGGSVAVIVPVLNEIDRLAPCLQGLTQQGDVVREIVDLINHGVPIDCRLAETTLGLRPAKKLLLLAQAFTTVSDGNGRGILRRARHRA